MMADFKGMKCLFDTSFCAEQNRWGKKKPVSLGGNAMTSQYQNYCGENFDEKCLAENEKYETQKDENFLRRSFWLEGRTFILP